MVIACPHALGLAVSLVVAVSTRLSATSGLLIRDRAAFERARNVDAVIFDKTGTLTGGRFGVTDVIALGGMPEDEVLSWAAALESASEHPSPGPSRAPRPAPAPSGPRRARSGSGAPGSCPGWAC